MIFDFDDFSESNHRYDLLHALKEANPEFRCTLFAVPGLGTPDFWETVPGWCELCVHGWLHPDPYECSEWDYDRMMRLIELVHDDYPWFVYGFKAPGWQISDGCYRALDAEDWWLADQPYNNGRRPAGLRVHLLSEGASSGADPGHWHGHVQDVCGNGIAETFDRLRERVAEAESFELVSEAVSPWAG